MLKINKMPNYCLYHLEMQYKNDKVRSGTSRNIRFTSLLQCQTLCYANFLNTFAVQSFQK